MQLSSRLGFLWLLLFFCLSCAAPVRGVVASQGEDAKSGSSYCNDLFLYCLSYPDSFERTALTEQSDQGGASIQFDQGLVVTVAARNDIMNLPFEQMYQEEMQALQKQYQEIREIGSVTYGTEFYEMEVQTPTRNIFVKRYRLDDKLITVRVTADLDYSAQQWQDMTGALSVSRK